MLNELPEIVPDHRILEAALREDLSSFILRTFQTTNPGTAYIHGWHIDLIAEYLTACTQGDITRLIINLPPRSMKSLCVSVAWPAWMLGREPGKRIITASYAQSISLKHSLDCRLVIQSEWYRNLFPQTRLTPDQNQKAKFQTTKRGYRLATSVGGSVTGEGGHVLIVDDPHNPLDMHNAAKRERTTEWYEQVFSTRIDNKNAGCRVVVMQRLHPQDLTGYLIAREQGWQVLALPAIADRKTQIAFGRIHRSWQEGEPLQPAREDKVMLKALEKSMGVRAFAAQYLQRPIREEGGLIERDWLMRYKDIPEQAKIVLSWDTAIKAKKENDYSVCTVWAEVPHGFLLLDVFRRQMEYPALKRAFIQMTERWEPSAVLVEDKASGQALIQEIMRDTTIPVIGIMPVQDKITRMSMVAGCFEAGKVWLPQHADWLGTFESELFSFPYGDHDDQVDATSQYLSWATKKKFIRPTMRKL